VLAPLARPIGVPPGASCGVLPRACWHPYPGTPAPWRGVLARPGASWHGAPSGTPAGTPRPP